MNKFSVYSCYAAISSCPSGMPLLAILKLVLVLVGEKKYSVLDPQTMVEDFVERFGFKVPYHPMQRIISLGINEKVFEQNSTLRKAVPVWNAIDNGNFMRLLKEKDKEYESLLKSFGRFLNEKHSIYLFDEELSKHVQAFIQRYGLIPKTDKELLISIKSDYYFADYVHYCIEHGDELALKCIDEYITGCSFAELITFSEPTDQNAVCNAKVYLDTGFVFALLGMESKNRAETYRELLRDMHSLGMQTYIFLHTYNEITGLIDNAKVWINNPNYDPLRASETAYFFVTNDWSVDKVTELQFDLKHTIVDDLKINIDDSPYPYYKDIRTTDQSTIQEMIVEEYKRNNRLFREEEKERTLNNDSHSLFNTLHYNGNYIAYSLSDVRFIFITTNKSLANVGRRLTKSITGDKATSIPIAMSDIEWGTLVWSNSPTKISAINRASIVSAAYAACQPSAEVLNKLIKTLKNFQDDGALSPEKCYFLKTNKVALSLLSEKTQNDDANYIDQLPFEILKEIQDEGYRKGKAEGQLEVDRITEEKKNQEYRTAIANQETEIERRKSKFERERDKLSNLSIQQGELKEYIESINITKGKADETIKCRDVWFKVRLVLYFLLYVSAVICCIKYCDSKIPTAVGLTIPVLGVFASMIFPNLNPKQIVEMRHEKTEKKVYTKYRIDLQKLSQLNDKYKSITKDISSGTVTMNQLEKEYKAEMAKLDDLSVDIRVVETAVK